jgi:PIN domain nuclease of toxin-antitoxin system
MLLLDTHVWIWSAEGDERRVGRRTQQLLLRAEAQDGIRVSPVTLFELAALHTSARLRLARPLEQWTRDALAARGIRLAELTASVAVDAGSIPRDSLSDPLDRLLVSTARQLGATFLTADAQILRYATVTHNVRTHDARL